MATYRDRNYNILPRMCTIKLIFRCIYIQYKVLFYVDNNLYLLLVKYNRYIISSDKRFSLISAFKTRLLKYNKCTLVTGYVYII